MEAHISDEPSRFGLWKFLTLLVMDCRFWMFMVMTVVLVFAWLVVTDVLNPAILADFLDAGIRELESEAIR
jgi:hypothetical protein